MLISYSLFEPKIDHSQFREWDRFYFPNRYWVNIPSIISVYNTLYPNTNIYFYLSDNITRNRLYPILEECEKSGLCHLIKKSDDYADHEPAMWRYIPVFNKLDDIIFCRDADSLPNNKELFSNNYFIENVDKKISTIRSHGCHNGHGTIMLAGLSNFRPKQISLIDDMDFDNFYETNKNGAWSNDQESIIRVFTNNQEWTSKNFLDFPINSQEHTVNDPLIPCESIRDFAPIDLPKHFDILDDLTKWPGEPIDCRGESLIKLLNPIYDVNVKIINIIHNNPVLKEFYFLKQSS